MNSLTGVGNYPNFILIMKDLQIAIADYYASKNESVDPSIRILPSADSLPQTGNIEGDVRQSQNDYYIFDGGIWNKLDVGNTEADFEWATDEELLDMLRQGEEEARG